MPLSERRTRRSTDVLVALHYQLAHARRQASLDAIVVADGAGIVMAAAGPWAACEELAAYAPMLSQGLWTEPASVNPSPLSEMRARVDVMPVDVNGHTVLLCARGGPSRTKAIDQAARGVARILQAA